MLDMPPKTPVPTGQKQPSSEHQDNKKRWYQKPKDYGATAWETRKVFAVTLLLGVATFGAVAVGIWQGTITRDAVNDQRIANEKQIARMDSAYMEQRIYDSGAGFRDNTRFAADTAFQRSQRNSTSRQIGIAQESMQKELRAYLIAVPSPPTMDGHDIAPFVIRIFNEGETPAYDVSVWAIECVNEERVVDFATDTGSRHTLHSPQLSKMYHEADFEFAQEMDKYVLDRPLFTKLLKGKANLFFWGCVRYSDAFGIQHGVKFRFENSWDTTVRNLSDPHPCKHGNEIW